MTLPRDEYMMIAGMRYELERAAADCISMTRKEVPCERALELAAEIAWRESDERQDHRKLITSNYSPSYLLHGIKGVRWESV